MFFLRPIRILAKALTTDSTPRQMALGFAMGLSIGLVPKGNLTAVVLMMLLCATRVNLAVGMLSALLFSWVGVVTDPVTHWIGHALLAAESLRPLWTYLYDLPVVPWTSFNNTIVLGSLLLGLALFYPSYRFSTPLFERYTPNVSARMKKFKCVQLLWGAQVAGTLK